MVVLTWRCSSKNWERFWYMFWVCTPDSHTVTNVCFLTSLLMRSSNFRSTECSGHFTWNCSWQTMKYQPGNWMTRFPSWYLTPWTMPSLFQDNLLLFICFDTAKRMTKKKKQDYWAHFRCRLENLKSFFKCPRSRPMFSVLLPAVPAIWNIFPVTPSTCCLLFQAEVQNHPSSFFLMLKAEGSHGIGPPPSTELFSFEWLYCVILLLL